MKTKKLILKDIVVGHGGYVWKDWHGPTSDLQCIISKMFPSPPRGEGEMVRLIVTVEVDEENCYHGEWGAASLED